MYSLVMALVVAPDGSMGKSVIVCQDAMSSSTILAIPFYEFLMFHQIFLSPQVKRMVIISNKYGIYQLPRKLPNDVRLRILEN